MPSLPGFVRPTLAELIDRISGDLNTRLPGRDSRVRRSTLWVLARVFAGGLHLLYGFAAWIARQILPDRADEAVLRRHAAIWSLTPIPAAAASGKVTFSGVAGSIVPAGSTLQRDDGAEYTTAADATIGIGGTVDATVTAVEPAAAGNCAAAVVLTLASPVAGVTSAAVVNASPDDVANGRDAETVDELRARLLARIARRPQGGSVADYEAWVREVYPSARVFVEPLFLGAGTVVVWFVVPGVGVAMLPTGAQVLAVKAYVDVLRPVTAQVGVDAPVGKPVALSIHIVPDTSAIRVAVAAELNDLFWRESGPGVTIPNSHLREAIARAAGEVSHTLTAVDGGAGTDDVIQGALEFAYTGVITWT